MQRHAPMLLRLLLLLLLLCTLAAATPPSAAPSDEQWSAFGWLPNWSSNSADDTPTDGAGGVAATAGATDDDDAFDLPPTLPDSMFASADDALAAAAAAMLTHAWTPVDGVDNDDGGRLRANLTDVVALDVRPYVERAYALLDADDADVEPTSAPSSYPTFNHEKTAAPGGHSVAHFNRVADRLATRARALYVQCLATSLRDAPAQLSVAQQLRAVLTKRSLRDSELPSNDDEATAMLPTLTGASARVASHEVFVARAHAFIEYYTQRRRASLLEPASSAAEFARVAELDELVGRMWTLLANTVECVNRDKRGATELYAKARRAFAQASEIDRRSRAHLVENWFDAHLAPEGYARDRSVLTIELYADTLRQVLVRRELFDVLARWYATDATDADTDAADAADAAATTADADTPLQQHRRRRALLSTTLAHALARRRTKPRWPTDGSTERAARRALDAQRIAEIVEPIDVRFGLSSAGVARAHERWTSFGSGVVSLGNVLPLVDTSLLRRYYTQDLQRLNYEEHMQRSNVYMDRVGFMLNARLLPLAQAVVGRDTPIKRSYSFLCDYESVDTKNKEGTRRPNLVVHTDRIDNWFTLSLSLRSPLWPIFADSQKVPDPRSAYREKPPAERTLEVHSRDGDAVMFTGRHNIHWREALPFGADHGTTILLHFVPAELDLVQMKADQRTRPDY